MAKGPNLNPLNFAAECPYLRWRLKQMKIHVNKLCHLKNVFGMGLKLFVVYLDQRVGAVHPKCWSKS